MIDNKILKKLAKDVLKRAEEKRVPDPVRDFMGELKDHLKAGPGKKKASAERVALSHVSHRVASRVRTVKASKALTVEAGYWGKHFARKHRAKASVTKTSTGVAVRFSEPYEQGGLSYSIYGQDTPDGIKWSSEERSRNLVGNTPREIEMVFNRSRNGSIAMYVENTRDWAKEVAYRYAMKESGK